MTSGGQVQVASADACDIPALVDLMHEFYGESRHTLDRRWAEESFRKLFGTEGAGRAWIASRGADRVGYVVVTLRHSMEFGAPVGFIDDLFVRPGARGRGVARALLAEVFDACREIGAAAVHVEAGTENAAASGLYRAFGLEPYSDGRQLLTARF